jgi:hypothetical protein
MKISYLTALACCLLLFSCSKSEQSSTELETIKKAQDPDFMGYLPWSALGGSGGLVELHGRTVHDEFNGRDKPREVWCTRPKRDCIEFHRVVDGIKKDFLNDNQRLELNQLCDAQVFSDIQNYFNTGNGTTIMSFIKEAEPAYWDGLVDGTKTILHGSYDPATDLDTYILTDSGETLEALDLIDGELYVFQI